MSDDPVPLASMFGQPAQSAGAPLSSLPDQGRLEAIKTLNPIQRAFLGALSFVEPMVSQHHTAVKLYNDVVQKGRTAEITENDISPEEREQFKNLVKAHAAANGTRAGNIDYPDYFKHVPGLDQNILGGFKYALGDDGSVKISDKYDFNADRAGSGENSMVLQALGAWANPRGLAAQIGRQVIPDTGGQGVPVNINLPGE